MTHAMISTLAAIESEIDGASIRLRHDNEGKPYLEFQPRNDAGELRWLIWSRDKHYDGWTYDAQWGASRESFDVRPDLISVDYERKAIGWSTEQISRAYHWAANQTDSTRKLAERFSYKAAAE